MKKRVFIITAALFMLFSTIWGNTYFFYVGFKNKNNTPFSLNNPDEFLSERALHRRALYDVPIDSTDLPVNPDYLAALRDLGLHVHATTKWMNGATVLLSDSSVMQQVRALPFVSMAEFTGINHVPDLLQAPRRTMQQPESTFNYGAASTQINQIAGKALHQAGYDGSGIFIAVIDAGFQGVNTNPAFAAMRNEGRLIGTRDFVNPNSDIYSEHSHGAHVLATMGGEMSAPDYIGTAPKASYLLLRSEAAIGEYLCEPDFWISAIEYADSVGVDVATTSLGYTTFDIVEMDYSYADLDGNTIRASIAANMAFEKGILMFNSAGNEGNKPWHYISVPADAPGVIAVGAVKSNGEKAEFSSVGPTADNRIKPELSAMGSSSVLVSPSGSIITSSGTSFSSPILAGAAACFLQATRSIAPAMDLEGLRQVMYRSASQFSNPDNQLGFGIPNFEAALSNLIATASKEEYIAKTNIYSTKIMIPAIRSSEKFFFPSPENSKLIKIYSPDGVLRQTIIPGGKKRFEISDLEKGIYIAVFEY